MPKPPSVRRTLRHACLSLGLLAIFGVADRPAGAASTNIIASVTLVKTPHYADSYEICVYSSAGFPMEDTAPSLTVGTQTFLVSRYLPGSSLDDLVFSLTPSQFLSLRNGQTVSVTYTPGATDTPAASYSFGTLNTPLLPKK